MEASQQSGPGRILGVLTYLALPAVRSVGEAHMRNRTMLEIARTMLALERFRHANGQWPESPEQLVPEFLDAVPIDPYTGGPIRLAPTPDGLVVYSAGPDGEDDGGKLDPKFRPDSDLDLGLHLWDVEHRGIPDAPELPELPDEVFAP